MADVFAFYNMSGGAVTTLRKDFSSSVGGRPGSENPAFGAPERHTAEATSFLVQGLIEGDQLHFGPRPIRVPIAIVKTTWSAAATEWEAIVDCYDAIADFPVALRTTLQGGTTRDFQLLKRSTWELDYETWDQRTAWIVGALLLEAQPFPIGQSTPKTFA